MKLALKIMFIIFIVWIAVAIYLLNTSHPKAEVVTGLSIFYLAFLCMPIFIYYRYKDGKYKKYILNDEKLRKAFNQQGKN